MSVEQDAARYRWLRENLPRLTVDRYETFDDTLALQTIVLKVGVLRWVAKARPSTVDEAVDKAMREEIDDSGLI